MQAELVGISLATEFGKGYYIPVGHREDLGGQLPLGQVVDALRDPFTNPNISKVGHNVKYDYVILARYGLEVYPITFDSMIAEWLRDPDSRNLGLKNLSWVRLGIQMTEIEELIGTGKNQISMAEVPINRVASYAADDAAVVLQLLPQLMDELSDRHVDRLFVEIEMPVIKVLADMEMAGIALDADFLERMSEDLASRLAEIKERVFDEVEEPFNLNSPQQLSRALFEKLRIAPPDRTRKTSSGFYSTAASVLEAIRDQHQVVDWVLEFRELSKLISTYVDALPQQINPHTGRIHTSYNQTGSVTGRIASSNPNLQNIPIRTELGRLIRKAFVADPGHVLLAVDYSQVELRIVAHMARDEAMIAAFRSGQDIHSTTAAAIYGLSLDAVSHSQRRHAKAINFGLIYGMSAYGLTLSTDLTLAESEDFVEAYFEQFPGVKQYLEDTRRLAAKQGYVETLLGRRRYFPGLMGQSNRNVRNREEREAVNAPIQGTAADIMKIAMLRIPKALEEERLAAQMLLQVHDELVFECPEQEFERTAIVVQNVMESAYAMEVPLVTEARSGPNWYDLVTLPRN
jgi:DNA polymerase-1